MTSKKVICHDLYGKEIEVDSSELTYRPSIYGILIEDGKILLSKQWDGYDFPGGGMDIHETIEETLKREFFEETGLEIEPIKPVHCDTTFFHPSHSEKNKDRRWNCVMIYFLVRKVGGNISVDNLDGEENNYVSMPEWVEISDIENIKFYNSVDSVAVINKALGVF